MQDVLHVISMAAAGGPLEGPARVVDLPNEVTDVDAVYIGMAAAFFALSFAFLEFLDRAVR